MNADDMKGLFERSLREGGMDDDAGPDGSSIAGRVKSARRRRAAGSVVAGLASVALVAAAVWQVGGFTNDPNPPATPTTTASTDDPTSDAPTTDAPTDDSTDGGAESPSGIVLHDFSDAVFGECGEVFTPAARTSELVVENGPSEPVVQFGGSWVARITNNGQELVQSQVGFSKLVVVDSTGTVVATPNPDDDFFFGFEGSAWYGLAPGESIETSLEVPPSCETGDWLAPGEYQAYGAVTFASEDGEYEQAQGGPWPLTVVDGTVEGGIPQTVPSGALPIDLECGAPWEALSPTTGYGLELLDQIRQERSADEPIDGRAVVNITQPIDSMVFLQPVVLQDGVVVTQIPGTDSVTKVAASAGTSVPLSFGTEFFDCTAGSSGAASTLPPGEYQVAVVALTIVDESTQLLAVTEPVDVVLE